MYAMRHRSPPNRQSRTSRALPKEPNAYKSSAPAVGIAVWVDMVATMDREHLDRFTRSTRRRFDETDLEPLKWAVIRRRRVLARQAWP